MKTGLIIILALCPLPLAAQTAEGLWTCEVAITGNPVIPGSEPLAYRFALDILPDGTAHGAGTRDEGAGPHPVTLAATWALEGQSFAATGTITNGEAAPFSFTSEFVSNYNMAWSRTFGSGLRYTSTCAKDQ